MDGPWRLDGGRDVALGDDWRPGDRPARRFDSQGFQKMTVEPKEDGSMKNSSMSSPVRSAEFRKGFLIDPFGHHTQESRC